MISDSTNCAVLLATAKQIPCAPLMIGIDADHFGRGRHQRPARIARIERRVGLDDVLDDAAVDGADRAAKRRHHAGGDGRFEPQRISDRHHDLAAPQVLRIAERCEMQIPRRIGAQQSEVGVGIDAEHARVGDAAFAVADPDLLRRADHMIIGQHQPVRRDDDSGAEPAALPRIGQGGFGLDADHRRPDPFRHADHRIGVGVEQDLVVGRRRLGFLR
jgi:hypothetical protein